MRRIILAGAGSSHGKTIITCGLLRCLSQQGLSIHSYKCGPDYIDPMFHTQVLGIPSDNMDTFFSDETHLKKLLNLGKTADISIIEGAMGIYDGLGGTSAEGSAYDLAEKTNTDIILIFNAKGMGRTMISLIKGILMDDHKKRIKGIILNRITKGYYETIAPILEKEVKIKVLGFLPEMKGLQIESRHLGLKTPGEIQNLEVQLDEVAAQIKENIRIDEILKLSVIPSETEVQDQPQPKSEGIIETEKLNPSLMRLAVAKDEAFCFYYEENLRILQEAGVQLILFSPLKDKKLPENIDGILLGGGYPENYLKELEENQMMKESIKEALLDGIPSLAECGGFMYLHQYIEGEDGKKYQMVGAIDGYCYNTGKLCRFGYVEISAGTNKIKGHEFHYYDSSAPGEDALAVKPVTGKQWSFGYVSENRFWGYPHLYYGSNNEFVKTFVETMKEYKIRKNKQ